MIVPQFNRSPKNANFIFIVPVYEVDVEQFDSGNDSCAEVSDSETEQINFLGSPTFPRTKS